MRDFFLPKLILTLQSWLDIIDLQDKSEIEEILVWYSGWKKFLLETDEIVELLDKPRTEEIFYLMMLLIDEKFAWVKDHLIMRMNMC